MKTQKVWGSFKVTGLLYGIVVLLSVNFYFIHTAFDTLEVQTPLISTIYIISAISLLFALYSIYFVRVYIHKQMKKHSIHDHDTALFNKKFFLAELHATFERADRNEYPLSMLSASFSADALNNVDKKTKKTFLKNLGKVFTSVTRGSDIVCRYDKNHIVVLLPLTEGEEALILEGRLQKALENEDLGTTSKVAFDLKSFQADWDENEASFVEKIG